MTGPNIVEVDGTWYTFVDGPNEFGDVVLADANGSYSIHKSWSDPALASIESLTAARERDRLALERLNELRSRITATQQASWSNALYPMVAILNDAGYVDRRADVTEAEKAEHLNCYGGAGGWPGHPATR